MTVRPTFSYPLGPGYSRLVREGSLVVGPHWDSGFLSDQEIPGPPNRDPRADSRFRPNRESGIPCFPIPAESGNDSPDFPSPDFPKKPGNRGNRESDFLSDEYQLQWTRNILSREYHASAFTGSMRLLFRV